MSANSENPYEAPRVEAVPAIDVSAKRKRSTRSLLSAGMLGGFNGTILSGGIFGMCSGGGLIGFALGLSIACCTAILSFGLGAFAVIAMRWTKSAQWLIATSAFAGALSGIAPILLAVDASNALGLAMMAGTFGATGGGCGAAFSIAVRKQRTR